MLIFYSHHEHFYHGREMVVNHVVLFDASDITFDTFDLVKHSSSCSRRTPQGHLLKVPGLTVGNIFAQLVVGPVRVGFHCSDVCSKWASLVCLTLGFQLQPRKHDEFLP